MEKFLSQLIQFKTLSKDLKTNQQAITWLVKQLKGLPVFIKKLNFNGQPALVVSTKKQLTFDLILTAHLDVVPGSEKMFKPVIKNNKIFGRGVFDMKYAIACYWRLLKDFGKDAEKYNLGIIITTDEEIGGFQGLPQLLKLGYDAPLAFLPDAGSSWTFETEAKGAWHLLIESNGKSAHGSTPWKGINAVEQLIDYLNILRDNFFCDNCKFPNHYHETLNIGKIEGGQAANKVPDFAQALIDIRYTRNLSKQKIKKLLQEAKKDFPGIKIKEAAFADHYVLDKNNKFLKLYQKIALAKAKKKIAVSFSHGSTDARYLMNKNIPTLIINPQGGGHHSEDEWLDLKDLEKFYSVLKEFVEQTARIK